MSKSRNWERRSTNVSGIFLLKLPSSRFRQASIAIEINPVDAAGSATKKRGIVIRSASELDLFSHIHANQKLNELSQVSFLMSSYHLPNVLSRYSDTAVFCFYICDHRICWHKHLILCAGLSFFHYDLDMGPSLDDELWTTNLFVY